MNSGNVKWCTRCKAEHQISEFGNDRTRYDGLSASCLKSRRVSVRKRPGYQNGAYRHGWMEPTRDGDKLQARRRINYLVEQGRIPHPDSLDCMDCADAIWVGSFRHEYDHARGYDGENQLYVEPVCSRCHRIREENRRDGIAA